MRTRAPVCASVSGLHSILGGLETVVDKLREIAAAKFTFHFGWIRNCAADRREYQLAKFTFHFGWIRNMLFIFSLSFLVSCLHSILGGLETFHFFRYPFLFRVYIPFWVD